MQVTRDKVVVIDYVLKDDDGNTIDQSSDGNFAYIHGAKSIIPGLEKAIAGKQAGDILEVNIEPTDAYGERDLGNIQKVPRNLFPENIELKAGMQFQTTSAEGYPLFVKITAVEDEEVVVDGNHPLAGMNLNFSIKVITVRDASEEELAHGHIHDPGENEH